uniref:Uncharacterized protein n=1 Tax=Cacopsylla melanoneura TaxID=428564 RepID=A0A8D8TLI1_9HEMI
MELGTQYYRPNQNAVPDDCCRKCYCQAFKRQVTSQCKRGKVRLVRTSVKRCKIIKDKQRCDRLKFFRQNDAPFKNPAQPKLYNFEPLRKPTSCRSLKKCPKQKGCLKQNLNLSEYKRAGSCQKMLRKCPTESKPKCDKQPNCEMKQTNSCAPPKCNTRRREKEACFSEENTSCNTSYSDYSGCPPPCKVKNNKRSFENILHELKADIADIDNILENKRSKKHERTNYTNEVDSFDRSSGRYGSTYKGNSRYKHEERRFGKNSDYCFRVDTPKRPRSPVKIIHHKPHDNDGTSHDNQRVIIRTNIDLDKVQNSINKSHCESKKTNMKGNTNKTRSRIETNRVDSKPVARTAITTDEEEVELEVEDEEDDDETEEVEEEEEEDIEVGEEEEEEECEEECEEEEEKGDECSD